MNGAKVISEIDLKSRYHQLDIHEVDMHQRSFHTHYGHYEFTLVPFGLMNAPSVFMVLMDVVLCTYLHWFLDDILIYSRMVEEH